jgi:hypothetical protein
VAKDDYLPPIEDFEGRIAHAIEEAGEFIQAAGKTLRFGYNSVNPDLPKGEQIKNIDWLMSEVLDAKQALERLQASYEKVELNDE